MQETFSKNILDEVGHTPLLKLSRSLPQPCANVYAKLEMFNPGGSIKDRICLNMIEAAEREALLQPGATVIEPTSGNTGIGLAIVCSVKKYRLILVMPENYSIERRYMMQEMGAKIVLTPADQEMAGAIERAEEIFNETPGAFMPRQFNNLHNPETHQTYTAAEVFEDLPAQSIDALVLGVGTGGAITGLARAIKAENPNCLVVAVEPAGAAVLSGEKPAVHKIQGIGAGFIPEILDLDLIDRIEKVQDEEAFEYSKKLSLNEGVLGGLSSGANFCVASHIAKELGPDKNVLTIFCDKGERYFSIEKHFQGGF
ncbi:MAG: cysteine synthase A [Deltaproteobacteria bacterium]|nr:cysteine synthase A [Deltaproteobacteria bacterium]